MTTGTEKLSAAEWIAKLSDQQELTRAEKAALADFMRESPVNVRELIEHTCIAEDLKALAIPDSDLDRWIAAARSVVAGTIPFPERLSPSAERARISPAGLGRRLLAAASLAAVLVGGVILLHSRIGLYNTGFGELRTLTLADGSVVTLNTESQIKVDFYDQSRSLKLRKGEAFFRVAHDTNRPFLVEVQDAIVRAVGTQFNVKIAPRDTVVSVLDGVVKVLLNGDASGASRAFQSNSAANSGAKSGGPQLAGAESQITLSTGQEARIERHPFIGGSAVPPIRKADAPAALHAAAWTQGRLEFEGAPLAQVLAEFQRYRQFDVEVEDDTTRQLKLTGSFDFRDPESVLAYIATIPHITVEKRGPHSYLIHRR